MRYKSWCLATFGNLDALERLTDQGPVFVDPEPGDNSARQGGSSPSLSIRAADISGHLAMHESQGGEGALETTARTHDTKGGACMQLPVRW